MKLPDIGPYEDIFYSYAEKFRQGGPEDMENIDYKICHSLRVREYAQTIVASLELDRTCARTALLAALFHDIGRFPQYGMYKTFLDRQSQNHGLLGSKTLRDAGFFSGLAEGEQRLIAGAVLLHNRRGVPASLSHEVRFITGIVRDADKLDIIPYRLSNLQTGSPQHPSKSLGLEAGPEAYSEEIYNDVMSGRMGRYSAMGLVNDFIMTMCGWVYDFNHSITCRLCLERGYMDTLLGHLPPIPEMKALGERVRERLIMGSCREKTPL